MAFTSPYTGLPSARWRKITERLIAAHPLSVDQIKELAVTSWRELWLTTIGSAESAFLLADINPPATVVGYFFEKLFLRNLVAMEPKAWRGPQNRSEKDLVFEPNAEFSIELKTSGQLGSRIFGNRSYGQAATANQAKGKSGYYITVNFYEKSLNLIRFGWIDHSDWKAQKSATGQMAGLGEDVYRYKLKVIPGQYQLEAPLELLKGVGPGTKARLAQYGINRISELLAYDGQDAQIIAARAMAREFLEK